MPMKISFNQIQKEGKQKYLIFLVLILATIAIYFLVQNFLIKKEGLPLEVGKTIKKVQIDFGFFESKKTILDQLNSFEEITLPADIQAGRENPFLPY